MNWPRSNQSHGFFFGSPHQGRFSWTNEGTTGTFASWFAWHQWNDQSLWQAYNQGANSTIEMEGWNPGLKTDCDNINFYQVYTSLPYDSIWYQDVDDGRFDVCPGNRSDIKEELVTGGSANAIVAGHDSRPDRISDSSEEGEEQSTATMPVNQGEEPLRIRVELGMFDVVVPKDSVPIVEVRSDQPDIMAAYLEANSGRITALLAQQQSGRESIDVMVTFIRPLPWDEFVQLRDDVGLTAFAYTFSATGPNGERSALYQVAVPDAEIPSALTPVEELDGAAVHGVIAVEGQISITPTALGKLVSDQRIFATDTTAVEATELLRRNEVSVSDRPRELDILLPALFWDIDWVE